MEKIPLTAKENDRRMAVLKTLSVFIKSSDFKLLNSICMHTIRDVEQMRPD